MKRRGNLLIICLVIVLSISSFYIYSSTQASRLPQFYIKKESGNEKELHPVELSGSLSQRSIQSFTISDKGTKYDSERTFMERFSRQFGFYNDGLQSYRAKYRSFMRGKQNTNSFYEDAKSIAYAGVNYKLTNSGMSNFHFDISLLDKKSKKATSFMDVVPKASKYIEVFVLDVQKKGKQLDVITENRVAGSTGNSATVELHDYQFDLNYKKLYQDETIMSVPAAQVNNTINLNQLTQAVDHAPSSYLVFYKSTQQTDPKNEGALIGPEKKEFFAYNYLSNKMSKINFTQKINEQNIPLNIDNWFNNENIYFTDHTEQGLEVKIYNIKKNKLVKEWKAQLPKISQLSSTYELINNNRLYITVVNPSIPKENSKPSADIMVINLDGKVLFKGSVVQKGQENSQSGVPEIHSFTLNI